MPQSCKIIFMGTPQFAVPALQGLINSDHEIIAVYTQPPKPQGRGHQVQKSAVHNLADQHNIPVFTPANLKDIAVQETFKNLMADIAVVAAYGLILPQAILDAPRHGCLNIHGSILPRWRGAAPVHRAIIAGDTETGVTIMKMDQGLDTGAMLLKVKIPIKIDITAAALMDELSYQGAQAILKTCNELPFYLKHQIIQPTEGITYAHKLVKGEGLIKWDMDVLLIERMVRTLNPWPGCYFMHHSQAVKIIDVVVSPEINNLSFGTIIDNQLTIACQNGTITLTKIQPANKQAITGKDYINGQHLKIGQILD